MKNKADNIIAIPYNKKINKQKINKYITYKGTDRRKIGRSWGKNSNSHKHFMKTSQNFIKLHKNFTNLHKTSQKIH